MSKTKIRLGICMAGAVSAGAYTAGVMDYLIETLERWEQAKNRIAQKKSGGEALTEKEKLVPDYDVSIEILSGASAGGMTAAILGYSLLDNTYLNKKEEELIATNYDVPDTATTQSKLYTAWVEMADDKDGSTFDKLMDTDDVKSIAEMNALLNYKPLDTIAQNALPKKFPELVSFPNYISKELSVFLTVTNLEGLPVEIKFGNTGDTRNQFTIHSGFLHYTFNEPTNSILDYPSEQLTKENYQNLITAAKSTGAFPLGLENQKVRILNKYMTAYSKNLFEKYNIELNEEGFEGKDYEFTAVDGGLINNEPIGTTAKFLKNYKSKTGEVIGNYLLLIDPFPNITNAAKRQVIAPPKNKYNLLEVAIKLFVAVRNQSMFKQEDLLESLDMKNNKYLIYPSKKGHYFLACGLIGGFCGFLKKAFRKHDYQLGRKNCQSFLRYYFGENMQSLQSLQLSYTEEQKNIWGYYADRENTTTDTFKMPLIPDMLLLDELELGTDYKAKSRGKEIATPHYDGLEQKELDQVIGKIENRVATIIKKSYPLVFSFKATFLIRTGLFLFQRKLKKLGTRKLTYMVTQYFQKIFKPQLIKQAALVNQYADIIVNEGLLYEKYKGVMAVASNGGELVVTTTSSGFETKNIADKGDYIVTNDTEAQERYVMKKEKFEKTYKAVADKENYYVKTERIYALPFTEYNFTDLFTSYQKADPSNSTLYIEAPWLESLTLREHDYLVCNSSKTEIYRIDQKEMEETYREVMNN
jgi:Patatin-like phospholipase